MATVISVYSSTPVHASINTFLFFISMLLGYYLYCNYVLGFLSVNYMMIWVAISFIAIFLAYMCWYAKGEGVVSIVISSTILGVLFAQTVSLLQGFYVYHSMELITLAIGAFVLYRKPKEFILVIALSVVVAVVYQLFIPHWG